jgi:hypothetical protein
MCTALSTGTLKKKNIYILKNVAMNGSQAEYLQHKLSWYGCQP